MPTNVAPRKSRLMPAAAHPLESTLARLRSALPEAFTAEGRVDINALRALVGDEGGPSEKYLFTWAGRRDAIRAYNSPGTSTVVPCTKDSVAFAKSRNLYLEGENLEMLKLLVQGYSDQVKCIYIDPPYNTGQDFIYRDNYAASEDEYLRASGQKDANGRLLISNPESNGRFHSDWLTMMYPRLLLAKQLLTVDGLIFVSIDDHEIYNLRLLMNEVFGEENYVETFIWKKSYGGGAKENYAVTQHEYILTYARNKDEVPALFLPPDEGAEARYYKYRDEKVATRGPYRIKPLEATKSMGDRPNLRYPIPMPDGREIWPKRQWWWKRERTMDALANNDLVFTETEDSVSVSYKQYLRDEQGLQRGAKPFSVIDGIYTQQGTKDIRDLFDGQLIMPFPKPVDLMRYILQVATDPNTNDTVLDFFSGSGTMAQAVLQLNREDGGDRRFIMVQAPVITPDGSPAREAGFETIAEIGKERIRRVIKNLESEKPREREYPEDLGFRVFQERESHIRAWEPDASADADQYVAQLEDAVDRLKSGWKAKELLWEISIAHGFSLTAVHKRLDAENLTELWSIEEPGHDRRILVCLDAQIRFPDVRKLKLRERDTFVCRDSALTDAAAANLGLQCHLVTI